MGGGPDFDELDSTELAEVSRVGWGWDVANARPPPKPSPRRGEGVCCDLQPAMCNLQHGRRCGRMARGNRAGSTMADTEIIKDLLGRVQAGDQVAAAAVYQRFASQLVALAREKLDPRVRRKVDPE